MTERDDREVFEAEGTLTRLDDRRLAIEIAGVTFVMREDEREIARDETTHHCELEEVRIPTWLYQALPDEVREASADKITIVEP